MADTDAQTQQGFSSLVQKGSEALMYVEVLLIWAFGFLLQFLVVVVALYLAYNAILTALGLMLPVYRNTMFGRFVATHTAQVDPPSIVKSTLDALGFEASEVEQIKKFNQHKSYQVTVLNEEEAKERLLTVLKDNIVTFEYSIGYGNETPNSSKFYIDTMSAALYNGYLREQTQLMRFLISQRDKESPPLDFVLAPKTGNVLLAQAVASSLAARCVFRKGDSNNSRARTGSSVGTEGNSPKQSVNIEGFSALLQHAEGVGRQLYGICVDCNCSGGSEIVRSIEEFNALSSRHPERLKPVSEAFVLYRPDQSAIRDRCSDGTPITINRFFDLSEADKGILAGTPNQSRIASLSKKISAK